MRNNMTFILVLYWCLFSICTVTGQKVDESVSVSNHFQVQFSIMFINKHYMFY